jgi:hypothetical protein
MDGWMVISAFMKINIDTFLAEYAIHQDFFLPYQVVCS